MSLLVLDFPLTSMNCIIRMIHSLTVPCGGYLFFSEFLHLTLILISSFPFLMGGWEKFSLSLRSFPYTILFYFGWVDNFSNHSAQRWSCVLSLINHGTTSPIPLVMLIYFLFPLRDAINLELSNCAFPRTLCTLTHEGHRL